MTCCGVLTLSGWESRRAESHSEQQLSGSWPSSWGGLCGGESALVVLVKGEGTVEVVDFPVPGRLLDWLAGCKGGCGKDIFPLSAEAPLESPQGPSCRVLPRAAGRCHACKMSPGMRR